MNEHTLVMSATVLKRSLFRLYTWVFGRVFGTRLARVIWMVPGSRALYRLLMTRLTPEVVQVDGHQLRLDPTDSLLLSVRGDYEVTERRTFRSCIRPGDTVIDIGAHIGLYTLAAAEAVGPTGRVIALEPMSANFELLSSNVASNGYSDRVVLHRIAVSDSEGQARLNLSDLNSGDNSLTTGSGAVEIVPTVTLDALLGADARINVMKMDIQGGEPAALAGAHRSLAANDDVVLFTELSPSHLPGEASTYLDELAETGFELFEVDEDSDAVVAVTAEELIRRCRDAQDDSSFYTNLVAVKGAEARERLNPSLA